jgi:hypothetical protein
VASFFRALGTRVPLVGSWLLLFLYACPGYMNFDSAEQAFQARTLKFSDWHPPLMTAYWFVLEQLVRGPLLMLVLQSVLFLWGLHQIFRRHLGEHAAAWCAAGVLLFPPVFTPMAVVWKDAQMAAFLVAGIALAMRPSRRARAGALVLWFLATGVRDNGIAAPPFVLLWAAGEWGHVGVHRVAVAAAAAVAIFVVAGAANRALTVRAEYPWYRSVAVMDVVGTIAYADELSDDELRATLADTRFIVDHDIQRVARTSYTPRVWFSVEHEGQPMFELPMAKPQRLAIRRAWWTLVREHPQAYLRHRAAVMGELLGLTSSETWEPVAQTLAGTERQYKRLRHEASPSFLQRRLGNAYRDHLGNGPLYRPWMYAVLALILLADALRRRDRLIVALLASGLVYEASFFIGAAAPDFRYSHWMVTCTCLAVVLTTRARMGVLPSGSGPCSSRS